MLISSRDEDGSRLSENELVDTLILMISAGHETTVNLLDQVITALLTHPEQRALVRSGEVPWTEVIEEALRWQAPVANLPLRYAVEDIDVDGVTIGKGEAIFAAYAAAGRDLSCTATTPTCSTSGGPTRSTSPSATACTSRRFASRADGGRSVAAYSSAASRIWSSPSTRPNCARSSLSSQTATGLCRST